MDKAYLVNKLQQFLFWKYNFRTSSAPSSPAAERLAKLWEDSSDLKSFFSVQR